MNLEALQKNLEERGFPYLYFPTAQEAADYLVDTLHGKTIGMGGSMTLEALGIYERLQADNQVAWHAKVPGPETLAQAAAAQVYLSSVNGIAETGELINIDGVGNRVASTIFGHRKVYFVVGRNKIAPDYDQALWRARNIAAPKNCQRLGLKTPCAVKADRCYSCSSPERSCRALVVLWEKPRDVERMEVILIDEELGY